MESSECSTPCSSMPCNDPYRVSWQDIIGQDDAKRALYESCILPTLLPSSVFVGTRQLCTTVLLYGPPGTGKTTLVRAVANESRRRKEFTFTVDNYLLELSPSACLSKWAGEAERRIQSFFAEARRRSPSILFLDEFDALAMKREAAEDVGARRVLSELLIQLTSVQPGDRITIVASTNRLQDLDPAVVRRFQKIVELPLPSQEERERIIQKGLNGISNQLTEEDYHYLSAATNGWSGSLLHVLVAAWNNEIEFDTRGGDGSLVGGIPADLVDDALLCGGSYQRFEPSHAVIERGNGEHRQFAGEAGEGECHEHPPRNHE